MKYDVRYPYIKVYQDSKKSVRYVAYKNQQITAMLKQDTVGNLLIDFVLLVLADYKERTKMFLDSMTADFSAEEELTFAICNAEIYEIAKLLNDPHTISCMFLLGKLDTVFSTKISSTEQIKLAVKVLEEVLILQENFADGLTMCCDVDFDKEGISSSGLFLAFTAKHQDFMNYHLLTGTAIAPIKYGNIDFGMIDKVNADAVTDKKEQLAIVDKLNEKGADLVSFTILQDFADFLCFEFTELLKQGLQIRKCKLCGNYFVLQSKHKTLFCDRIYSGKRTCKQVGNKQEYDRKIAADPVLQEYERIYKARHAQMERDEQKESPADSSRARNEFNKWSVSVKEMRKQYLAEKISEKEFMQQLAIKCLR